MITTQGTRTIDVDHRKVLYMIHVDWRWIKQRPQFLAENLAEHHDVLVLHRKCIDPGIQLTSNTSSVSRLPLLPVPWSWKLLRWAAIPVQRWWVARMALRFEPDTIWLTHPALVEAIPTLLAQLPVVYDCMDDALGFPSSPSRFALLARLERDLVTRAAVILCSSGRLCELLISRYGRGIESRISLVRNGVSERLLTKAAAYPSGATKAAGDNLKIAYFGTIAEWFDFEILLAALNRNPALEFHLAGPISVGDVPRHERLKFHKPLCHDELAGFAADFDAFIMPFRLSPLTEAVDPVKLYEYLAFGKEVITVRYEEVERFSRFVHFYRTLPEFLELMDRLMARTIERKNASADGAEFLAQNTWHARCNQICELLAGLNGAVNA